LTIFDFDDAIVVDFDRGKCHKKKKDLGRAVRTCTLKD
jgi:hypothetical protein